MEEILTLAQIEAQFQSEWVLVEEPLTNDALEVQSGKVRWHSKDREEVYRKAVELDPKRFAILYTGKMPEDTAIVLACLRGTGKGASPCLSESLDGYLRHSTRRAPACGASSRKTALV